MAISETKMQMVIANYFKDECDVNTSIKQAFEKGFRIGVKKGASANRPQGEWEIVGKNHPYKRCPFCKRVRAFTDTRFCDWCGARMKGADDDSKRD